LSRQCYKGVEFLAHGDGSRTLLDSSPGFFAGEPATRVNVSVEYERPDETAAHDGGDARSRDLPRTRLSSL